MARPATHNRRDQEVIYLRVDSATKKNLKMLCENKNVSVQQFLEDVVKDILVKSHTEV